MMNEAQVCLQDEEYGYTRPYPGSKRTSCFGKRLELDLDLVRTGRGHGA